MSTALAFQLKIDISNMRDFSILGYHFYCQNDPDNEFFLKAVDIDM